MWYANYTQSKSKFATFETNAMKCEKPSDDGDTIQDFCCVFVSFCVNTSLIYVALSSPVAVADGIVAVIAVAKFLGSE